MTAVMTAAKGSWKKARDLCSKTPTHFKGTREKRIQVHWGSKTTIHLHIGLEEECQMRTRSNGKIAMKSLSKRPLKSSSSLKKWVAINQLLTKFQLQLIRARTLPNARNQSHLIRSKKISLCAITQQHTRRSASRETVFHRGQSCQKTEACLVISLTGLRSAKPRLINTMWPWTQVCSRSPSSLSDQTEADHCKSPSDRSIDLIVQWELHLQEGAGRCKSTKARASPL